MPQGKPETLGPRLAMWLGRRAAHMPDVTPPWRGWNADGSKTRGEVGARRRWYWEWLGARTLGAFIAKRMLER